MLMETLHSPFFAAMPSALPASTPRTPPYTPYRTELKFQPRLVRSGSPISPAIILPSETISPPKPRVERDDTPIATESKSTLKIRELVEGDAGFITDTEIDVIHPAELEEVESTIANDSDDDDDDDDDDNDNDDNDHDDDEEEEDDDDDENLTSESEGSVIGISQLFHRMGYTDAIVNDEEAEFHIKRRMRHLRRRANSRVFKRPHSQSVTCEDDDEMFELDPDSMADHDIEASARRLRRRVRGPPAERIPPLDFTKDLADCSPPVTSPFLGGPTAQGLFESTPTGVVPGNTDGDIDLVDKIDTKLDDVERHDDIGNMGDDESNEDHADEDEDSDEDDDDDDDVDNDDDGSGDDDSDDDSDDDEDDDMEL